MECVLLQLQSFYKFSVNFGNFLDTFSVMIRDGEIDEEMFKRKYEDVSSRGISSIYIGNSIIHLNREPISKIETQKITLIKRIGPKKSKAPKPDDFLVVILSEEELSKNKNYNFHEIIRKMPFNTMEYFTRTLRLANKRKTVAARVCLIQNGNFYFSKMQRDFSKRRQCCYCDKAFNSSEFYQDYSQILSKNCFIKLRELQHIYNYYCKNS